MGQNLLPYGEMTIHQPAILPNLQSQGFDENNESP